MSEEQELDVAVLGHAIRKLFADMYEESFRTTSEWGRFADRIEELERIHHEVYSLRVRLAEAGVLRGSGDRRPR